MGVIYEPKQTVKGQECACKTPAVNEYSGSPYMENKGPRPAVGLIWQCDDCGKFWKVVNRKIPDYSVPHRYWSVRKYILVKWYHMISWGRINRHKRKGIEI